MMNLFLNKRLLGMAVSLLMVTVLCSACDPLRKKFVRKKKQSQESQEFIPVLEPQEYLPLDRDPLESYKQHYSMIKVWYRDLWSGVNDKNSDKSIKWSIKQIHEHIDQMKLLLKPERSAGMDKLKDQLAYYLKSLDEARAMRNYARIQSDLRAFDRMLRAQYREDKVKGNFVGQ